MTRVRSPTSSPSADAITVGWASAEATYSATDSGIPNQVGSAARIRLHTSPEPDSSTRSIALLPCSMGPACSDWLAMSPETMHRSVYGFRGRHDGPATSSETMHRSVYGFRGHHDDEPATYPETMHRSVYGFRRHHAGARSPGAEPAPSERPLHSF